MHALFEVVAQVVALDAWFQFNNLFSAWIANEHFFLAVHFRYEDV